MKLTRHLALSYLDCPEITTRLPIMKHYIVPSIERILYHYDEVFFSLVYNNDRYLINFSDMKYWNCMLIQAQFIFNNCFLIVNAIYQWL